MRLDSKFEFGGKNYAVSTDAYSNGTHIILPDNTILQVGFWEEVYPPHPVGLERRNELPLGSTPEETAKLVGGTVAHEV